MLRHKDSVFDVYLIDIRNRVLTKTYLTPKIQQTKMLVTLISLINVEPTLTDFEKFHPPQNKNPPSTFIEFLDFSTLYSSFIRVMY